MAELIIGASYPARRSAPIVVGESKQGALMVYIPFTLTGGIAFSGNHSVCIGTKDGTLQERAIEGLRDIFGWKTENPFDLQRLEIPEGDAPEFVLADYHNEPYANQKGEEVDSYKFRWLNKLGSGIVPATEDDESAAMAKWSKKFSSAPSTPKETKPAAKAELKPAKNPAEKTVPKRTLPAKSAARTETIESITSLLCKKHGKDENNQDDTDALGNEILFPTVDKFMGQENFVDFDKLTKEQWGQIADSLGL